MKRTGLLTAMLLLTAVTFTQVKVKETTVTSPKFIGAVEEINTKEGTSPICNYLMESLTNSELYSQGVLVVQFSINADGTLSEFDIVNSISDYVDKSVVSCLKRTSGKWKAGTVNGMPKQMRKEIQIRFVDPTRVSLEELAQSNLELGLRKYNSAKFIKENNELTAYQAEKKANRKLKSAIKYMEEANRYQPDEPSFIFWQAVAYELAGNEFKRGEKLNRFMEMIDLEYHAQIESVDILLR
jgi:hypothetical protein